MFSRTLPPTSLPLSQKVASQGPPHLPYQQEQAGGGFLSSSIATTIPLPRPLQLSTLCNTPPFPSTSLVRLTHISARGGFLSSMYIHHVPTSLLRKNEQEVDLYRRVWVLARVA